MKVKRYYLWSDPMDGDIQMGEHEAGAFVQWEDYEWMSDYAQRLVEHGNLPCLPKDLENLRETNTSFAMENFELTEFKSRVSAPLTESDIKDIYNTALLDQDSTLFMWEKLIKTTHEHLLNKVVK